MRIQPPRRPAHAGRSRRRAAATLTAAGLSLGLGAGPALAVSSPQDHPVGENAADFTPQVLDGSVDAIVQVGRRMVLGGTFHRVRQDGRTVRRDGLLAFDARTGVLDAGFHPSFDGPVQALDTDGASIYAAGSFDAVDGHAAHKIVKLTSRGTLVAAFAASADLTVSDLVIRSGRVYVGGAFTAIGQPRRPRGGLAALDPTTGRALDELDLPAAGRNSHGRTQVRKLDVTPDGRTLVAIGNFTSLGGQPRRQMAMVDLPAAGQARVSPWATRSFGDVCNPVFNTYLRDLDISPDGRFVVVTASGGYFAGTLCDSVSRWEVGPRTGDATPTWVDSTGGDTSLGVAVTGPLVYVGGHFRWFNNPYGDNEAGAGAVPREGIAALDVRNGLPLSWNPGRARGFGAQALYTTPVGLWVGSDTARIGRPREQHGRIAFLPLAAGPRLAQTPAVSLPGELYQVLPGRLTRRPVDARGVPTAGPSTVPTGPVDWAGTGGAFLVRRTLYYGSGRGLYARSFDPTTGRVGPQRGVDLHDGMYGQRIPFPTDRLTGAFFEPATHRLYYTVQGSPTLYYRFFTPDSEVVGAQTFTAPSGGADLRSVSGMVLAGGRVLYGSADGRLRSINFSSSGRGGLTGSPTVVSADGTWTGNGLFVPAG